MSHTSRRRSSANPRSSVIGTWVWALTRPGMTTRPPQSIVSAAAYVSAPGPTAAWETRKLPLDVWTSAALPTDESGELASTLRVIVPLETLALIVESEGAVVSALVGLPPHPCNRDAIDTNDAAWTQNSRRVGF